MYYMHLRTTISITGTQSHVCEVSLNEDTATPVSKTQRQQRGPQQQQWPVRAEPWWSWVSPFRQVPSLLAVRGWQSDRLLLKLTTDAPAGAPLRCLPPGKKDYHCRSCCSSLVTQTFTGEKVREKITKGMLLTHSGKVDGSNINKL